MVHGCEYLVWCCEILSAGTDRIDAQVGALQGYDNANAIALELWEKTYPNALQIALTDTFSSEAFFKVMTHGTVHGSGTDSGTGLGQTPAFRT